MEKIEKRIPSKFDERFMDFWTLYPRHDRKQEAHEYWCLLGPSTELVKWIMSSLKMYMQGEWKGREKRYIPLASTWINEKRWEDYMSAVPIDEPELKKNEHWCRFCPEPHVWVCPDPVCTAPDEMPCPEFLGRLRLK